MKIGILTHHYINNFGAFLQAYSLQNALQEMFPADEVFIIDYVNLKHFVINTCGWFRFYIKKENLVNWMEKIQLPFTFAKARRKYLSLTPVCYTAADIEKLDLDYIVVGSDEVWNYRETKGNAKVKFGAGLDREQLIAYAPSVGQTDELDIPDYVKNGIQKFKAVSARDLLTEKLARKIRNEAVARVPDPTFLANIPDEKVCGIVKPYILFYYCDGLPEQEKEKIIGYAHLQGMSVYGAGECDKRYTSATVNLTPFQWVWMFKNAQYVVTGTFHGTVFSILNHRQFACYLTNPSRIEKVGSLLQQFGLQERSCKGRAEDILNTLNISINYDQVDRQIQKQREQGRAFLTKAIDRI